MEQTIVKTKHYTIGSKIERKEALTAFGKKMKALCEKKVRNFHKKN